MLVYLICFFLSFFGGQPYMPFTAHRWMYVRVSQGRYVRSSNEPEPGWAFCHKAVCDVRCFGECGQLSAAGKPWTASTRWVLKSCGGVSWSWPWVRSLNTVRYRSLPADWEKPNKFSCKFRELGSFPESQRPSWAPVLGGRPGIMAVRFCTPACCSASTLPPSPTLRSRDSGASATVGLTACSWRRSLGTRGGGIVLRTLFWFRFLGDCGRTHRVNGHPDSRHMKIPVDSLTSKLVTVTEDAVVAALVVDVVVLVVVDVVASSKVAVVPADANVLNVRSLSESDLRTSFVGYPLTACSCNRGTFSTPACTQAPEPSMEDANSKDVRVCAEGVTLVGAVSFTFDFVSTSSGKISLFVLRRFPLCDAGLRSVLYASFSCRSMFGEITLSRSKLSTFAWVDGVTKVECAFMWVPCVGTCSR